MRNIKEEIVSALSEKFDNLSDTYPRSWAILPAVQITEEENRIYEATSMGECSAIIRYRVDIWSDRSTSENALAVDEVLGVGGVGLKRTQCADVDDPTGHKHKLMRYEGIVYEETDLVAWL